MQISTDLQIKPQKDREEKHGNIKFFTFRFLMVFLFIPYHTYPNTRVHISAPPVAIQTASPFSNALGRFKKPHQYALKQDRLLQFGDRIRI